MRNDVLEVGQSYRLVRDFEVRDETSGTLKRILRRDTLIKVKKVQPEEDRTWIEDLLMPLPLSAFVQHIIKN